MADTLKTDYVDDVLDTSENTTRVYDILDSQGNVIESDIHLVDKTVYTTNGDKYGAQQINEQNTFINNLKESFSQALADLRNTAIAQAAGVVASDTFEQIVTKLGAIVNRGKVTKALTGGETYTIPQGYHDGTGTVSAPAQTGTYSATTNGTHDMGATNTYRYVSVSVPATSTTLNYSGPITSDYFNNPRTISCAVGDIIVTTDKNHQPSVSGATLLGTQVDTGNTIRCRIYRATSTTVTINPTGYSTAGRIYRS